MQTNVPIYSHALLRIHVIGGHYLAHVKRGVVRCLYDRAREVISMQDNLQKEVGHLATVLKQTLQTLSAMLLPHPHRKQQTQTAVMKNRKSRGDLW